MHIFRYLNDMETFIYILHDYFNGFGTPCFRIKIKGSIQTTSLQTAINEIQQKHYLLRASVGEKQGKLFFYADKKVPRITLEIINRANDESWKCIMRKLLANKIFESKKAPLLKIFLLTSKDNIHDLIIIMPHYISDLSSSMIFFNDLFKSYMEITTKIRSQQDQQERNKKNTFFSKVNLKENSPIKMLPHRFTKEDTADLIAICKKHSVSMFGLFAAVYLPVLYKIIGNGKPISVSVPIDMRKFGLREQQVQIGGYVMQFDKLIYPPPHSVHHDIWSLAKYYRQTLKTYVNSIDIEKYKAPSAKGAHIFPFYARIAWRLINSFFPKPMLSLNIGGKFTITGIDSILKIESFNWSGNLGKLPCVGVNVVTLNDELQMTVYTSYENEVLDKIFQEIFEHLRILMQKSNSHQY